MNLTQKTVAEMTALLWSMKEEQEGLAKAKEELPDKITTLEKKLEKKRITFLNAEGWYEDAVNHLDMVKSRDKQVKEIIEELEAEIKAR